MRILLINTTEKIGGPAVAASRLMEALKNNGIKAKLLVRDKQTEQITVVELPHNLRMVWKFVWERIVIWKANHFNRNHLFAVDIANAGTDITNLPEFQQADIIHLHWINQGMLSLKNIEKILASGKPVVPASATTPADVRITKRSVIIAPSSTTEAGRKTSPTASSSKSKSYMRAVISTL